MEMIKIIGIGLTGTLVAILLKEYKPVFSVCVGFFTALTVFLLLLSQLTYVFDTVGMIAAKLSIEQEYIQIVMRIIGIAYLTGLGGDLCRDAGQTAIGKKIELAGRILIVVTSLPVLTSVLNLLTGILPA